MSSDSSTYLLEILFNIKLKFGIAPFVVIVVITHSFWRQNSHLIPQAELQLVIHLTSQVLELQAIINQKHFDMIFLNQNSLSWYFFMEKRDLPQSPPILTLSLDHCIASFID